MNSVLSDITRESDIVKNYSGKRMSPKLLWSLDDMKFKINKNDMFVILNKSNDYCLDYLLNNVEENKRAKFLTKSNNVNLLHAYVKCTKPTNKQLKTLKKEIISAKRIILLAELSDYISVTKKNIQNILLINKKKSRGMKRRFGRYYRRCVDSHVTFENIHRMCLAIKKNKIDIDNKIITNVLNKMSLWSVSITNIKICAKIILLMTITENISTRNIDRMLRKLIKNNECDMINNLIINKIIMIQFLHKNAEYMNCAIGWLSNDVVDLFHSLNVRCNDKIMHKFKNSYSSSKDKLSIFKNMERIGYPITQSVLNAMFINRQFVVADYILKNYKLVPSNKCTKFVCTSGQKTSKYSKYFSNSKLKNYPLTFISKTNRYRCYSRNPIVSNKFIIKSIETNKTDIKKVMDKIIKVDNAKLLIDVINKHDYSAQQLIKYISVTSTWRDVCSKIKLIDKIFEMELCDDDKGQIKLIMDKIIDLHIEDLKNTCYRQYMTTQIVIPDKYVCSVNDDYYYPIEKYLYGHICFDKIINLHAGICDVNLKVLIPTFLQCIGDSTFRYNHTFDMDQIKRNKFYNMICHLTKEHDELITDTAEISTEFSMHILFNNYDNFELKKSVLNQYMLRIFSIMCDSFPNDVKINVEIINKFISEGYAISQYTWRIVFATINNRLSWIRNDNNEEYMNLSCVHNIANNLKTLLKEHNKIFSQDLQLITDVFEEILLSKIDTSKLITTDYNNEDILNCNELTSHMFNEFFDKWADYKSEESTSVKDEFDVLLDEIEDNEKSGKIVKAIKVQNAN